jgi:hypothetical protein
MNFGCRVTFFFLDGGREIIRFLDHSVHRRFWLFERAQISATVADRLDKLMEPAPLIASHLRKPGADRVGIRTGPGCGFDQ